MTEERANELRQMMAETEALREHAANARERAANAREHNSELAQEAARLMHIAKSLCWGLSLRYGAPQAGDSSARWTINREQLPPLTLELAMPESAPSTLWIFDPHCAGAQAIQSIKLHTDRDAQDAWELIKSHLTAA